jgi:Ca2+-dependent lipid-binding protein
MDPFCKFEYDKKKFKTPVCNNGGKHPKWNHTEFSIKVVSLKPDLKIELMDSKALKSSLIGFASIPLWELCAGYGSTKNYKVFQDK